MRVIASQMGDNSDEGAKYNDFNRKERSLLDIDQISEFNFSQEVFQRKTSSITEEVAIKLVPEKMMDENFWQEMRSISNFGRDIMTC